MMQSGKIKVHGSVFIALGFFTIAGYGIPFLWALLFITLHECTHILTGMVFHAKFEEIYVTPLGERAKIKGIERLSLCKRLTIYLSGPAASILFGIVFSFLPGETALWLCSINLAIGCFNLLPVLPLDGGCAALQILGRWRGILCAYQTMEKISRSIARFLIFFGLVQLIFFPYNISIFLVGCYIIKYNQRQKAAVIHSIYKNLLSLPSKNRVVPIRQVLVYKDFSIMGLIKRFTFDTYTVVYYQKGKEWKRFGQREIMAAVLQKGALKGIDALFYEE